MRKGISGFPSIIYIIIIFLIVLGVLFLITMTVEGKTDDLFSAMRDILKGFKPSI